MIPEAYKNGVDCKDITDIATKELLKLGEGYIKREGNRIYFIKTKGGQNK